MRMPLHPMVVHFPVAAWSLATIGDVAGLVVDIPLERVVGVLLVVGLLSSLVAMGSGLYEFSTIEKDTPQMNVANQHMLLMMAAAVCYGGALFLRLDGTSLVSPSIFAISSSIIGFVLLAIGGHLGATLVYKYGVGMSRKT